MKKKRILSTIMLFALMLLCSCNSKKETQNSRKQDLEYIEEESSLSQYEVKKDNTIEIVYHMQIVNNTNETKYFYLYADMAKEDDNLVKEDKIPAYEKKTDQKQIYKLSPNEGKDEWFEAYFRGTHGTQELKEDRRTLAKSNVIIKEIEEEDIPEEANVVTVDDIWED